MRLILSLALPIVCGTLSLAQMEQRDTTTLNASVFLITKDGDLKPARFAKVKAFYLRKQDAKEKTMGQIEADYVDGTHSNFSRNKLPSIDAKMCLKELESLVSETEDTASTMAKSTLANQVVTLTLDEEGKGSVKVSLPGTYVIAAFGNAGVNTGFWFDMVKIEAGKETLLKMPSPLVSCVREQ